MVENKAGLPAPGPVVVNGNIIFTAEQIIDIRKKSNEDAERFLKGASLDFGNFTADIIGDVITSLLNFEWESK